MNCCDYDCNQGRDCPARVAKIGKKMPAAKPLTPSASKVYLRYLAKWMLVYVVAMLVMATFVGVLR
jgi:hypothetical protein